MKHRRFAAVLVAFLIGLMISPPVVTAAVPDGTRAPASDDPLRGQLTEFFTDTGRLAPTALGDLSRDPEAMAGLRRTIASLNPEDLAALKATFSEVPDWQAAPEALSSAFQMQVLSDTAARRATDLERFRTEVSEFYAVLRLLPADSLQRLNQDPVSVAATQARIHDMPARSLALLQIQMDQQGDWRGLKGNLLASLSPGARAGLRAFADKGPLEDRDFADLSAFRKDLDEFLGNLKRLPPGAAKSFDAPSAAGLEAKLRRATPEMVFMIRQRIDTPALRQAMSDVRVLARAGSLTGEEHAGLERFRADLAGVYGSLRDFTPGDPAADPLADRIGALSAADLLLARERVERIPGWKRVLPAIFAVASGAGNRARLALLEHGSADAGT
ncbi:MAG: hypothetical protein ACRD5D_08935, partial [Candidatus Polarisedimenticolia bacterium]